MAKKMKIAETREEEFFFPILIREPLSSLT